MTPLLLVVSKVRNETDLIRRIWLRRADGAALPGYAAGAHITLHLPGAGLRKYSLVNADASPGATSAPAEYQIGVRLDAQGEGGSRAVHALGVGDEIRVDPPANTFPLAACDGETILIAGGIGITPLISMAAELRGAGRPFRLVCAVRSPDHLAFRHEIGALAAGCQHLHDDAQAGGVFDMSGYLAALPPEARVCVCGPKPMLKAAIDASRRLGWPQDRLKFELFYTVKSAVPAPAPAANSGEGTFEVVLSSSGKSFTVPPDKTILDVLVDAGLDILYDCKRGECGVCQVGVIEGQPDHKDVILSQAERAAGKLMQICISRSKSPRLVLDL